MSLKALTLWRPWSWAICFAGKRIENRPWRPPQSLVGQYLALHAGKTYDKGCVAMMRDMGLTDPPPPETCPQGIVAVCKVARYFHLGEYEMFPVDMGAVSTDQLPWVFGPYCWVLDEVTPIEPVPCKGAQGLWEVPEDALAVVRERWDAARKAE